MSQHTTWKASSYKTVCTRRTPETDCTRGKPRFHTDISALCRQFFLGFAIVLKNFRFEQSGHLNKIRAHICQHAITTLKGMPTQINTNGNNAATIKIQAINLLVADFLMNQDNLFTLKVLITEVFH